jgi:hypothetical protein
MGFYFQTVRQFAGNPARLAVLKKEAVRFSIGGWTDFAKDMRAKAPGLSELFYRVDWGGDIPRPQMPVHPTYRNEDSGQEPLEYTWTADECRKLFRELSGASLGATEMAYDFWELLAIVCCGINEEGLIVY